jgi:AcrR family transcriptional regulator
MPRRYSMAKRGRATERTRQRIELALIGLLASKPFGAITIADIAKKARVSARTVQRHYDSKDDLLAACISFPARSLTDDLSKRPPAASPRATLRDLLEALFSFYEANSEQAWAVYSRAQDVPVLEEFRQAAIRSRESLIDALFERWPDSWSTSRRRARAAILGLSALGTWAALTDAGRFTSKDAVEFVASALERTLLK